MVRSAFEAEAFCTLLLRDEPMSPKELAEHLKVSYSHAMNALGRLHSLGLVLRVRMKDPYGSRIKYVINKKEVQKRLDDIEKRLNWLRSRLTTE